MTKITVTTVPVDSEIVEFAINSDFHDAITAPLCSPERSAMSIYLGVMRRSPMWVDVLMSLRNKMVRLFGLKDLGGLGDINPDKPADSYRVGERVGIFTIRSISEREVVLEDSDSHLDVRLSVFKDIDGDQPAVVVTTAVKIHNLMGHVYMFVVTPMHKLIAPAVLRRMEA